MANGCCSKCGDPLDGAHKSYCKKCQAEYVRVQRATKPELVEYNRAYRVAYMANHPEKRRQYANKANYGLTSEQFESFLNEQDSKCAICRDVLILEKGKFATDHDHVTGVVRGILCRNCNVMIGHARESQVTLSLAIAYLRRHNVQKKVS